MNRPEAVIVSACRTPIGSYLGSLLPLRAADLGGVAIAEAVRRAGIEPAAVQECIMGHVVPAGQGQNPARQAALKAGLPDTVNAFTINKVCGSGLKAVMLAAQAIKVGDADVIVAGGMESMSNAPHLQYNLRGGVRMGDFTTVDALIQDGLWCAFNDVHMGNLAEYTAEKAGLSREDLDAFAAGSQQKAAAAIDGGAFDAEIVPVPVPQRSGDPVAVRHGRGSARRHHRGDPGQAAAGVPEGRHRHRGQRPGADRRRQRPGGGQPRLCRGQRAARPGDDPRVRCRPTGRPRTCSSRRSTRCARCWSWASCDIGAYDLIEANEAFASQCLADGKELGWDWDRVNVNGGAIALGHPIGASGARILTTLLYAMQARDAKRGLATLCLGGGGAVALAVEREG